MRHLDTYQLFEKKQTGVIYHFTKPKNLLNIIEDDSMRSGHGHISFSRNFNLKSWYEDFGAICRIAFNGSDMSDRFKIEPYMFDPSKDILFGGGSEASTEERRKRYRQEMEERIKADEITGISKYIVQIDILDSDDINNKTKEEIESLDVGFPINFVKRFEPVKGQIT